MENSCREKYKPSPKKWILASSYPEFRRNSALIPANAGLFHYAGNNPIRYIDPDGNFEVDSHNPMRIFANLDDDDDLMKASVYLKAPNCGYTVTAYGEKSGITKNFNSCSEIFDYINQDHVDNLGQQKKMSEIDYQGLLSSLSTVATEGQIFTHVGKLPKASNFLGNAASILGGVPLFMEMLDAISYAENGDNSGFINWGADVIIYGIGFFGIPGAVLSLYLGGTKGAVLYFDDVFNTLLPLENARLEDYLWERTFESYGY